MSHKVSYKWFRKTQVIPEYVVFYKKLGVLLGELSDCEELVGVTGNDEVGGTLVTYFTALSHWSCT